MPLRPMSLLLNGGVWVHPQNGLVPVRLEGKAFLQVYSHASFIWTTVQRPAGEEIRVVIWVRTTMRVGIAFVATISSVQYILVDFNFQFRKRYEQKI